MIAYARPRLAYSALVSIVPALAAGLVLFGGDEAVAASCPTGDPPCITRLEAKPTSGGKFLLVVHFSAACKYDIFHLQLNRADWSPKEWSRSRSHLCNQQVQTFLITASFQGASVTARIQGCVKYIVGKDRCTAFSPPETIVLDTPQHIQACRNYANRAVGAVKYARDMKCDPKVISGPRWSSNFDEHFRWCQTADPKTANFEDRERNRIAQECRIKAGMPQTGTTRLSVASKGGDTFTLSIAGFAANVPVIIDVSGPGAQPGSLTVDMKGNRIVAGPNGAVTVTLFGAKVCKRGGGRIEFVARDQDGRKSNMATSTCAP